MNDFGQRVTHMALLEVDCAPMSVIRGVDGCKGGWLCLSVRPGGTEPSATVFNVDARDLFAQEALITAIDIPIGLPSNGPRVVDVKARGLLGPLKSSVFPAPVRATLNERSYEEACGKSYAACGKKLSKQTFAILPRIREVDLRLHESPDLLNSVREVHPEVCFVYWNGGRPLKHPKTSGFGFSERIELVRNVFVTAPERVRNEVSRHDATDDDILDAFAALWTAQRIYDGRAMCIDGNDHRDGKLPMEMWA